MINSTCAHRFARFTICISMLLALASCAELANLFKQQPKSAVSGAAQRQQEASEFMYHLSVAGIFLENARPAKEISNNVRVVEHYTSTRPVTVPAAIIEYRSNAAGLQRVIAPLPANAKDLSYLSKLMERVNKFPHTLSDISLASITAKPGATVKLPVKDAEKSLAAIYAKRDELIAGKSQLAILDEARLQIAMLKLFIKQKNKDAAYLCTADLKRLLAKATQDGSDAKTTDALSQEFATLEGQLRTSMPY
jgi:hypothetical protein